MSHKIFMDTLTILKSAVEEEIDKTDKRQQHDLAFLDGYEKALDDFLYLYCKQKEDRRRYLWR